MRGLSLLWPPPQVKPRWTRPGSNRHLRLDRGLCCQLHHGPATLYMPELYLYVQLNARRHDTIGVEAESMTINRLELWIKGLFAAAISGGAGGVLTGFAAVGIDPQHFNLQTGMGATLRIAAAAALINAVIGVAAYLQKSPLPSD